MFLNDKDLKKGAPVKKAGLATSAGVSAVASVNGNRASSVSSALKGNGKDIDIVETAKLERDKRELLRAHTAKAIRIQAWFRGRITCSKFLRSLRSSFDSKLGDIKRLGAVLNMKGVAFIPNPSVVAELTALLLFRALKDPADYNRTLSFVSLIISPSLSQMELSKNGIQRLTNDVTSSHSNSKKQPFKFLPVARLFTLITQCFWKCIKVNSSAAVNDAAEFTRCIRCIFGCSRPHRLRYPEPIEAAFYFVRTALADNGQGFQNIREVLRALTEPIATITDDNDDGRLRAKKKSAFISTPTSPTKAASAALTSVADLPADHLPDLLFDTCISLVVIDEPQFKSRLVTFVREVLTVEALFLILSVDAIRKFVNWDKFVNTLDWITTGLLGSSVIALPATRNNVFHSGFWLMGNICTLSTVICTDSPMTPIEDTILVKYFNLCSTLLLKYHLNGVLQGISGVVLISEGSNFLAAGVPCALKEQLMSLSDSQFARDCYTRVLLPLRNDVNEFANREFLIDISESLKQSSAVFVGDELTGAQQESQWFTSKWARKVLSSVGKSISGTSSSSAVLKAKKTKSATSDSSTNEFDSSLLVSGSNPLPETDKSFQLPVLIALCRLWAIILPPAAVMSTPDSKPYRNLTAVAFSTRYSTLPVFKRSRK
jgi:hypothetical protein